MCLEEATQPESISLLAQDVIELQKQQDLIENQWRIIHALEAQRDRYVVDHYGIDLAEDWELDLVEGRLRHGR